MAAMSMRQISRAKIVGNEAQVSNLQARSSDPTRGTVRCGDSIELNLSGHENDARTRGSNVGKHAAVPSQCLLRLQARLLRHGARRASPRCQAVLRPTLPASCLSEGQERRPGCPSLGKRAARASGRVPLRNRVAMVHRL